MKKTLIGCASVAFAAALGLGVYALQKSPIESDLMRQNIEALANDPNNPANPVGVDDKQDCWDTITTGVAQKTMFCGTCGWIDNSKPSTWASKGKC
ncbi:MAG: NVEALA domain-containing protein [Bacteroidales bacterium]|nr:NVEALA domain-containing protein [Bacteroidales bacterium]